MGLDHPESHPESAILESGRLAPQNQDFKYKVSGGSGVSGGSVAPLIGGTSQPARYILT